MSHVFPYDALNALVQGSAPRLLIEADLWPVQGERFQPTGFPDLGAATYTLPDGTPMLLVESPQSVANRLEMVCWDEQTADLVLILKGLPYVRVTHNGRYLTSSIQEAHRLNSPYILESADRSFFNRVQEAVAGFSIGAVDVRALARFLFKYDTNAVLHGVFLSRKELVGGRLRLPRVLSGFIEARDARPAESGGVKFDRVDPAGDPTRGFGHVPFHRTEYTARRITAYFNLDLAMLRGYALPIEAMMLLVGLALWKIRRFLDTGLRLRTACDLDCVAVRVTRPEDQTLPEAAALEAGLPRLIAECGELFASPRITEVVWEGVTRKKGDKEQSKQVADVTAEEEEENDEEDEA